MQKDMFCFKLRPWQKHYCYVLKPPSRATFQGKKNPLLPASVCASTTIYQSWVSLLIKTNGRLMTGVVSFNVTFVFIFHPDIPLSEDSGVYKPTLQSSRVTITTVKRRPQPCSFSSFSLSDALRYLPPPHFFLTISASRCFCHQRRIDAIAIGPRLSYSRRVTFHSHTVAFAGG